MKHYAHVPTAAEAYARLLKTLDAKPVTHRNALDWQHIAEAERDCETARFTEYLAGVRRHG